MTAHEARERDWRVRRIRDLARGAGSPEHAVRDATRHAIELVRLVRRVANKRKGRTI